MKSVCAEHGRLDERISSLTREVTLLRKTVSKLVIATVLLSATVVGAQSLITLVGM